MSQDVWEKICPVVEIPPGSRKQFPLGTWDIVIFNAGNRFFASSVECPHLGVSLMQGELRGHVVRCGAHGYEMDLTSGRCLTEAGIDLPIFPVEVRDGWIWVRA